jgi:nucleoside 2-deoxyribosyltransferase
MKVYVASKLENYGQVREVYRLLTELGHEITHDWTEEFFMEDKSNAQMIAELDYNGVCDCDILFLINYQRCAGAFTELGIALHAGKVIVVVDGFHEEKPSNIFFHLPMVNHFDTIEDAIKFVEGA